MLGRARREDAEDAMAAVPDSIRDLRRGQIVTAARRLVAEQGLEALTIGALEDRVSFTRGVITSHFANKDEIVQAVFASAIDEIDAAVRRAVEGGSTGRTRCGPCCAATCAASWTARWPGACSCRSGGGSGRPRRAQAQRRPYAKYRRRAAKLLRAARAEGLVGPVDPTVMGALLSRSCSGFRDPALLRAGRD